jgi:putative nucleotidyltransferase with HDIG domain
VRDPLLEFLPELQWVENAALRDKVAAVWREALRRGGWTAEDVTRLPFVLDHGRRNPPSLLEHCRGVVHTCRAMSAALVEIYGDRAAIGQDVLLAGALLHDVGKLLEFRESHGTFTASRAGRLLPHPLLGASLCLELGLPEEVVQLVAVHADGGLQTTGSPEALLLHLADRANLETLR